MKTILSLILMLATLASSAKKITAVVNEGDWKVASTWSPAQVPASGDTVIIPSNISIKVKDNITLNNVFINVLGVLKMVTPNVLMSLGNQSSIIVYVGGVLQGTLSSQIIMLGLNTVYNGSQPDINGPMYASNTTGNSFVPYSGNTLPVRFVSFNAMRTNADVLVQWSTSEEFNASHYDIERSFDGNNFKVIGTVSANGNSSTLVNYSFTDKSNTASVSYYRIRQVDLNGVYTYTTIKPVRANDTQSGIDIRGNNGRIVLNFSTKATGVSVRVISLSGQVISESRIANAMGQVILDAPVKGHYVVSVSNGSSISAAAQVIL